jgi:2-oxoisovalerate dehydrogenase E1 component alpha subunit
MGIRLERSTGASSRLTLLRDMYTHMLLVRLVDEHAWRAYQQGHLGFVATCRGHEAAQVGSAMCIEVGQDFTLPYYRDLGVVLTIGMTPYEVFRTYRQTRQNPTDISQQDTLPSLQQPVSHWGYHKHNLVTAPAPVATQVIHAAGIAFACKLRKAPAVTVAYCGDGATAEPDFLEGITFAAQHQLPAIFICEQDTSDLAKSTLSQLTLPPNLQHHRIDGSDILLVHAATQAAIQHARAGHGSTLLEICITRATPDELPEKDPLQRCIQHLQEHDAWDEIWARELEMRLSSEVEQALADVLRDT